jgi:hypothetical protein
MRIFSACKTVADSFKNVYRKARARRGNIYAG